MKSKYVSIQDIILNAEKYYAHTRAGEKTIFETLEAHTLLCVKYFKRLSEEKGVEGIVSRFQKCYMKDIGEVARDLYDEMWRNIIVFHDFGKINPNYQRDILKNSGIMKDNTFQAAGSRHSGISGIIYMDYYLKKIKHLEDKKDRAQMKLFLFYHSYIISRHHSDLVSFEEYLQSLINGYEQKLLCIFEEKAIDAYHTEFSIKPSAMNKMGGDIAALMEGQTKQQSIWLYGYGKLLFSLLVASDYYAASEFINGVEINNFGNINDIEKLNNIFRTTEISESIEEYKRHSYPKSEEDLKRVEDINLLRSELYLEAESSLLSNLEQNIFYLEAPTGSGKSNTAMNLSFQLASKVRNLKKIFYVYPFNTLVEQNQENLYKVFGHDEDIKKEIKVVNSITPIGMLKKKKDTEDNEETGKYYQQLLLNRQFLNYPMILTTHVSIFDTLFGDTKESAFGFHQMANSIIILDEIQSYKNKIWSEIISFLKEFAVILNMKVIIMSATLPNLDLLTDEGPCSYDLIQNREKYFLHPCFRDRVVCNYEMLEYNCDLETILRHVDGHMGGSGKILIEFIKKRSADDFYQMAVEHWGEDSVVLYMSGDDSPIERKRILDIVKAGGDKRIILVATTVVEAGVDIDMDIGYKNIAKLDSEEQFMGRISRSRKSCGTVYFFKLDDAKNVYGEDVRLNNEFTLENIKMRDILSNKDYPAYYNQVLNTMRKNYVDTRNETGVKQFFAQDVSLLRTHIIKRRMQLIDEDNWSMNVYLSRILKDEAGKLIDGKEVWQEYKELLRNQEMEYAEKKVKLSHVVSRTNLFIYQIKKNSNLIVDDYIGELLYIEDGDKYFENGKLNRRKVQGEIGDFVDFI